jgi:hypothetical protein
MRPILPTQLRHRAAGEWRCIRIPLISVICGVLAGCVTGSPSDAALHPDENKTITAQDSVDVKVTAIPGTDMGTIDLDHLAKTIGTHIDRRKARIPSSGPPRQLQLALSVTRYDPGSAAGAAGQTDDGSTHIDGSMILTDRSVIAWNHRWRDLVVDKQPFSWGREYPGPTDTKRVENDFAEAMAIKVVDSAAPPKRSK